MCEGGAEGGGQPRHLLNGPTNTHHQQARRVIQPGPALKETIKTHMLFSLQIGFFLFLKGEKRINTLQSFSCYLLFFFKEELER